MYVTVQKIYGKSKVYGYSKDVVTTTIKLGTTIYYSWNYSEEKFERENYSYKIVIKESYRKNGKVKQKQVVMGTFHWFDFIDHYVSGDEYFDERLIEVFPDKQNKIEKIYGEIDRKISEIGVVEFEKWRRSEEYKIHNQHLEMIQKYEHEKKKFEELYGTDYFEQIYDIHLNIRNQNVYEQLSGIKKQKEAEKEEKRREQERRQKQFDDFYRRYTKSDYSIGLNGNYTDKEKELLKKFYRTLAVKFHPDVIGENEPMQLLNKLKEQLEN